MATGAVRRGFAAAGLDVEADGPRWEVTPRTVWRPATPDEDDAGIDALDAAGIDVQIVLGTQTRTRCSTRYVPGLPGRVHIDSPIPVPFGVPMRPGDRLPLLVRAVCVAKPNGEPLAGPPLVRTLVRGTLEVPQQAQSMGAAGTTVMLSDSSFVFLHAAEVEGEPVYVAAHASLLVV